MSSGYQDQLTLNECLILLRLDGPTGQSQEGWEFDYNKIDKALDFLRIVHPVRLGFKAGIRKFGDYDSFTGIHQIKVSTYMEIDEANETLWHELAHAMQAERLEREHEVPITRFYKVYENAMGPSGNMYKGNAFEIEAKYLAKRYSRMALLA